MEPKHNVVRVTISNRTVLRILGIIVVAYIGVKLFFRVDHILELIFISFFLAIALNPAVSWFAKNLKLKSRAMATAIAYLIVVVVLVSFFALVLPPLVRQTENYVSNLPNDITSLKQPNTAAGKFVKHYKLTSAVDNLSQEISRHTSRFSFPVWSTASRIGGILASILIVFVLTFMMIVEGPVWLERYWKLRVKKQTWHTDLANRMYRIVTGYVNGQLLLALLGGVVTLVSLLIVSAVLNVSVNEFALAAIIILTGLIPMFGHIFGSIVVVLACLFVSWPLALIMAIILFVYVEIANVTIQPYVQAKYNDLSPMLVLIAALLGISAGGIIGAFVAIPLAGCAKIALKELLLHRNMID